jgi:hypothetical protein
MKDLGAAAFFLCLFSGAAWAQGWAAAAFCAGIRVMQAYGSVPAK